MEPGRADLARASHAQQVTIGLPVYNGGEYLAPAIESLLSQTHLDIRLLISDNASTDGSERVCRAFAERDPRVTYERLTNNIGGIANHQRVRERATSPFFMWAAGDDIWEATYVEECLRVLAADQDVVVAYAINAEMDELGHLLRIVEPGPRLDGPDPVERFAVLTNINTVIEPFYGVMRTDHSKRAAPLRAHPGFDRIFFAELALRGKLRQVASPLYRRRRHSSQSTGAYPSLRSRYKWISPDRARRVVWPHFGYLLGYAAAANRASSGLGVLLRCWHHVARWAYWHHRQLWCDVLGRDMQWHPESR
jgi:glycosyltransferase involved in cell wall biosynthesis